MNVELREETNPLIVDTRVFLHFVMLSGPNLDFKTVWNLVFYLFLFLQILDFQHPLELKLAVSPVSSNISSLLNF